MYKIEKKRLSQLLSLLSTKGDVYLPVKAGAVSSFSLWQEGVEVDFESLITEQSPKNFFFAENEVLYESRIVDGKISVKQAIPPNKSFILFGLRACDLKGIGILDSVFLAEPEDIFYKARRENGVLITLACPKPEDTCFCKTFHIDCEAPGGDISLWIIQDDIYWKPLTKKGHSLTETVLELLEESELTAVDREKERIKNWWENLPNSGLTLSDHGKRDLLKLFASSVWKELYSACLGCGACTFLCPTCHCYDIRDFDTGNGIIKQRCWDSCMYSDFTLMAHGNPRTSQKERFRQRFLHKLVYHPDNYKGEYACTGCGRCVAKCPASLNIIKVMKKLEVCTHV